MKTFGFMVMIALLASVSEAGVIRELLNHPSSLQEITHQFDIPYGEDKKERLDLYLPSHPHHAPIIVMVHGGAWKTGDKKSQNVVYNKMNRWVSHGAIFVSLNYRLVPKVNVSQQVEDIARALGYVESHALAWGGDPDKIVLMGHSSGGHLVSLLSANPQAYVSVGLKPWLGSVSLDAATVDVVKTMEGEHYRFYDEVFGNDPEFWEENSPYHRMERSALPILLVCSSLREDGACEKAAAFKEKGVRMGLRIEVSEQPLTHAQINDELGLESRYTAEVEAFLRSLGMVF